MQLAKVIGSMVSTRKSDRLHGLKLLVAVPIDMDTFEEKGAKRVDGLTVLQSYVLPNRFFFR